VARVRALLRRSSPQALSVPVSAGGLSLDPEQRRVVWGAGSAAKELRMGPAEFRLLHFLMTHPQRIYSRAQLLDKVWGDHVYIEERTVDVHIKRLRDALAPVAADAWLETVRGSGYRFAGPGQEAQA
jgi:two-component system phosphate regulon response regulator PhoB